MTLNEEGFMRKYLKLKNLGILFFSVAVSLVVIAVFVGAQGKGTMKPDGKPQQVCNYNDNCEYEEYISNKSFENQPCLDCLPKTYGPLTIGLVQQIVGMTLQGQACQYKYTGNPGTNGFEVTWASDVFTDPSLNIAAIGDIDNDGAKEIIVLCCYTTEIGKGKNKTYYFNHELLIFEDGDMGEPTSRLFLAEELNTARADDIVIADVDNDKQNELLVLKSGTSAGLFEIYGVNLVGDTHDLERLYIDSCQVFEPGIWRVEVGDVDNDLENEILLAQFLTFRPTVLDFNGNGWTAVSENIIEPIGSDEGFFDDGSINFNIIRVSDVDGDTMNELVAGGNNGRLMIWEYNNNNEHYDKIFVNPDPIDGATWALDTGEIDGDLINEIVIGRSRRYDYDSNFIVVFKFYGGTYQQVLLQPIEETSPNGIHLDRIGVEDLDGDGMAEIVAGLNGLTIYKYVPGQLQRIYNYAYGRSIEIN